MNNNAQIFSLTLYPDEIETLRNCAKQEGLATHQDMCRSIIRIYLNELKNRATEENIKAVRAARKSNGKK